MACACSVAIARCSSLSLCTVQLADFGLAKHLVNQTHMTTVCGTWAYSAPEVRVFRQPYNYKVRLSYFSYFDLHQRPILVCSDYLFQALQPDGTTTF